MHIFFIYLYDAYVNIADVKANARGDNSLAILHYDCFSDYMVKDARYRVRVSPVAPGLGFSNSVTIRAREPNIFFK